MKPALPFVASACLLALSLSSCGKRGPIYLPPPAPDAVKSGAPAEPLRHNPDTTTKDPAP